MKIKKIKLPHTPDLGPLIDRARQILATLEALKKIADQESRQTADLIRYLEQKAEKRGGKSFRRPALNGRLARHS